MINTFRIALYRSPSTGINARLTLDSLHPPSKPQAWKKKRLVVGFHSHRQLSLLPKLHIPFQRYSTPSLGTNGLTFRSLTLLNNNPPSLVSAHPVLIPKLLKLWRLYARRTRLSLELNMELCHFVRSIPSSSFAIDSRPAKLSATIRSTPSLIHRNSAKLL